MKTQTQSLRKVIMWYKVKELTKLKGTSDKKIANQLGIDRRTVSRYKKMSEEEFKVFIDKQRVYQRILESYYSDVLNLLDLDNGLPAAVIEDRLKEKYPDLPKVNSKTVYNFVQYVRKKEKIFAPVNIRQTEAIEEFAYGSQAQVDFGESWMQRPDKSRQKVYFFALVLSRSRYKYVFFQTTPFTGKTAVQSHEQAFKYIEGMPKMLLYDQDSVFLKNENLGDYLLADDFRRYKDERRINVNFCRKADPQTKGRSENVIGYVKHNFLRARTFYDIDRFNEEALGWLERTANGTKHATTQRLPYDDWMIEKDHLMYFKPTTIIPRDKVFKYTVRKDNTISYQGNFYRVPYGTYNGKGPEVLLSVKDETLLLYDQHNSLIAEHPISLDKGKIIGSTTYRRDRNLRLEVFKQEVLSLWQGSTALNSFIEEIHKDKPRYLRDNLKVIREVIGEYSEELVSSALNYCLEHSLYNAFYLKEAAEYYRKLKSVQTKPQAVIDVLREGVHMKHFNTDAYIPERSSINRYEQIVEQL